MVMAAMKRLARGAQLARLRALISNFRLNKRGNVAVITALALLPMVAAMGCAVDYSMASMVKTKLQAAADAASLATVSINSSVITTAESMSGNGTVSGGSTFATNYFNANLAQAPESNAYTASSLSPTATVTKTGTTITATVSFTAQVPDLFHGHHGLPKHCGVGHVDGELHVADLHRFLSDARRIRLDELPVNHRRAVEAPGRQSRQPERQQRLSRRLHVRLSFHHARRLRTNVGPRQSMAGIDPRRRQHNEPGPGRLLPRIYHFAPGNDAGIFCLRSQSPRTATTSIGPIRRSPPALPPEPRRASNCAPMPSATP